jgi:hypothetical protein
MALAALVCEAREWELVGVHFYTGIPSPDEKPFWNHFWTAKLAVLGTRGVATFSRPLRYHAERVPLPDMTWTEIRVGVEKGVDVRLALDVVRLARQGAYDVAVIFSQDQDLSEAVAEVKAIAASHKRRPRVACAFPANPSRRRGIDGASWISIDKEQYDTCIDPTDYRPPKAGVGPKTC